MAPVGPPPPEVPRCGRGCHRRGGGDSPSESRIGGGLTVQIGCFLAGWAPTAQGSRPAEAVVLRQVDPTCRCPRFPPGCHRRPGGGPPFTYPQGCVCGWLQPCARARRACWRIPCRRSVLQAVPTSAFRRRGRELPAGRTTGADALRGSPPAHAVRGAPVSGLLDVARPTAVCPSGRVGCRREVHRRSGRWCTGYRR